MSVVIHICVLILFSLNAVIEAASCAGSYTYQNGEFCYAWVSEQKTWADAQNVCKAIGGYLVEITTEEQNRYVEAILFEHPQETIWVGATDLVSEGKWFWATSDTAISAGFTYWHPGQPDNGQAGGENCMEFQNFGNSGNHWNDNKCDNKFSFICQKSIDNIVVG